MDFIGQIKVANIKLSVGIESEKNSRIKKSAANVKDQLHPQLVQCSTTNIKQIISVKNNRKKISKKKIIE